MYESGHGFSTSTITSALLLTGSPAKEGQRPGHAGSDVIAHGAAPWDSVGLEG